MKLLMAVVLSFTAFTLTTTMADGPDCYQLLTSVEKQELVWHKISAEPYLHLPALDSEAGPSLRQLFFSGIGNAFTSPTDEIAPKRTKIIHRWGSAVKIKFEADPNSLYSGIFKTGAAGIARMSLALPFKPKGEFVPGLAVKLFVDGQPSVNLTVMEKLEGQGPDTNYFKSTFTNILPDPQSAATKFGTWAFEGFVENAIQLQVDHVAAVSADGSKVDSVKAPFQLIFVPADGVATSSDADFREELAKIPAGTAIYEVYGKETNEEGSPVTKIGRIVTDSNFVASAYEDEKLYFQHAGTELKTGYVRRWIHLPK